MKELVTCRSLSIGYGPGEGVLCADISLVLREGEYLSVVGAGGSGKSAVLATLLGALPPMAGEVIYENGLKREEIGCMPQTNEIRGSATVPDTVLAGCLGQMNRFFVGRRERNAAFLARALCGKKRLLLLDEPLKGLDTGARDDLFAEIERIRREDGCAVVMADAEAVDGTVLHLSDRVLFCGPVEDYIRSVPGQLYFAGHIL